MSPLRMPLCFLLILFASAQTTNAQEITEQTVHSRKCFVLKSPSVEVSVTEIGGHMAPVTFFRDTDKPVQPYHISPWQDEPESPMPAPVLVSLRGDFFCMPFGGNQAALGKENHPPHGEVAGAPWKLEPSRHAKDVATMVLSFETKVRPGKVTKELSLVDSHNVIYTKHTIEGFEGKVPLGHHATLAMPDKEGSVRLSSSAIRFGMTYPGLFSDPKLKEYQSLLPGEKWTSLSEVPLAWKNQGNADVSRQPGRQGFADLVQIYNESPEKTSGVAWMTATFPDDGYVWFSMKDPSVLNSTVFWMENHGRHGHPWNGRNNCLGLEDVTAYFADGLVASMEANLINQQGIATTVELTKSRPTTINYIQGVARIPDGFDVVTKADFAPGQVTFWCDRQSVIVPVRHEFLRTGKL
ncbi:MAG: hypothetical protein JNM43_12865 [Planctomycetaceae bacterium]|nr:hypothetical protein [Planctomycetaceae bacterium]